MVANLTITNFSLNILATFILITGGETCGFKDPLSAL